MKALHLIAAVTAVALAADRVPAQNLFKQSHNKKALISDHRAANVGDILTITVQEATRVINEDKVDRQNNSSLAARLDEYSLSEHTFKANILPRFDARQQRNFRGEAKQEKDSNVRASIAVIVVDVQPNGNLVVAGSRTVEVDDETKTLKISGIVRPLDISKLNEISSTRVADARVSLTGEGANTRITTRGPLASMFDVLWWAAWPF